MTAPGATGPFVSVLGSWRADPGSPLYRSARRLGAGLAEAGHRVATGGGLGVMQAVCEGVVGAGGVPLSLFLPLPGEPEPNPSAGEVVHLTSYLERTTALVGRSRAVVALAGGFGTLDEVTTALVRLQVGRSEAPLVLVGDDAWRPLSQWLAAMVDDGRAAVGDDRLMAVVAGVDEALEVLADRLAAADAVQPAGVGPVHGSTPRDAGPPEPAASRIAPPTGPDFDKMGGLLPVVVQDDRGEVLMQAFMDRAAYELTLSTGLAHYWSRKKQRLWQKGEQSGHVQRVQEAWLDNDADSLLLRVDQVGGAVEDGYRSCFYFRHVDGSWRLEGERVFDPRRVYDRWSDTLRLAVATGSLGPAVEDLLTAAGLPAGSTGRDGSVPDGLDLGGGARLELTRASAWEVPQLIADGRVDAGLTGSDAVAESGTDPVPVADLGLNKHGLGAVRWVLAVHGSVDDGLDGVSGYAGRTVVTQAPRLVASALADAGVPVGAVHLDDWDPVDGVPPVVCEISETGGYLRERGYRPTHVLSTSTVRLWAGRETWGYGWQRRRLLDLADRLSAVASSFDQNPKQLLELPLVGRRTTGSPEVTGASGSPHRRP